MVLMRVGRPDQIQWKSFLRIAAPLAAVVGFFMASRSPLGWLILLPGSVVFAIHVYRRRQPGPLRAGQGAKLGVFTGLVSVAFLAVFLAAEAGIDPAGYRQTAEREIKALQEQSRNTNPETQQMIQSLSNGTRGIVLFTVAQVASSLMFLPLIGGISGALAVALSRRKSP